VIITAILASKFLNERLNLLGKMGCFLCIIGSTIIVIHSPKENEVSDLNLLIEKAGDPVFVTYVIFILALSFFIAFYLGPRIGHKNVLVYIVLCSAIGSLTVMSCKALGLAIRDTISGKSNDFGSSLPYILVIISAVFIVIQMNYLNKALDIFNTSIVTPIYYVIFTSLVITASAILFKEWRKMSAANIVGDACGFLVVICAVILLNAFKDMDVSMDDVRSQMRPRRRFVSVAGSARNSHSGNVNFEEGSLMQRGNYGTSDSEV
jgi:drug/metabolite transporter (DMT)-like permease